MIRNKSFSTQKRSEYEQKLGPYFSKPQISTSDTFENKTFVPNEPNL